MFSEHFVFLYTFFRCQKGNGQIANDVTEVLLGVDRQAAGIRMGRLWRLGTTGESACQPGNTVYNGKSKVKCDDLLITEQKFGCVFILCTFIIF